MGYSRQFELFKKQTADQNEITARSSSVTIILKLEDQFEELSEDRSAVATEILNSKLLDAILTEYEPFYGVILLAINLFL